MHAHGSPGEMSRAVGGYGTSRNWGETITHGATIYVKFVTSHCARYLAGHIVVAAQGADLPDRRSFGRSSV